MTDCQVFSGHEFLWTSLVVLRHKVYVKYFEFKCLQIQKWSVAIKWFAENFLGVGMFVISTEACDIIL
jgi:hypothetical protein